MKRCFFTIIAIFIIPAVLLCQPLQNHLLIATSTDGLNFTKLHKVLFDNADVPDAVVDSSNHVYVYFQGNQGTVQDAIMVGISSDGLNGWAFQPVKIAGIENWHVRPCDPDIIYKDGKFRLYFTGDPTNDHIPETYSAISDDGINFTLENGMRFSYVGKSALDPSLLWIGDTLHYFAGGGSPSTNWHAISTDGLQFNKLDDFSINGMMMSNGIQCPGGYRFYGFSNKPPQNIQSIFTLVGEIWTADAGIRLEVATGDTLENMYVKDPAIIYKDSAYIMYYVSRKAAYSSAGSTGGNLGNEFELNQNYPNPFSAETEISYNLNKPGFVSLKVYDIFGKEIANLVDELQAPGNYSITFNGTVLSKGLYFYVLQINDKIETGKMFHIE